MKPWQVDGKQYALPFTFGIEGFWYNKDLFEQAGIDGAAETLDELKDAIEKLTDVGVTPIAVGAGDQWPAAHWWYQFALALVLARDPADGRSRPSTSATRAGSRLASCSRTSSAIEPVPGRLPRDVRPAGR